MKILLTGGSGMLGTELQKIDHNIIAPAKSNLDVQSIGNVVEYMEKYHPDVVIHAAAHTDNKWVENNPTQAVYVNICGTSHVAMACYLAGCRMVYISTDYIYKGDRGNYKEDDEILPFNLYSWTKLGGECAVRIVKNHLIIRTSFGSSEFNYPVAFIDKWSSKEYVDKIAPMIYQAAISPLTGVVNIGGQRRSLYNYASERNPSVKGVKIADTSFFTPYDTSLNLQKWYDYQTGKPVAQPHLKCRICGSGRMKKYLDLNLMPLANNLEFTAQRAKAKERYPLQVMYCEECSLSQLSVVIDPDKMFSYYTYRSSVNKGYVTHCRKMAQDLQKRLRLNADSFMVDIAGNDGALLIEFRKEIGLKVLNVDPATNLTPIAEAQGIPCETEFWTADLAANLEKKYGKADLITATNVFAHVDNLIDFITAVRSILKEDGILVLEFPYLIDFIENMEFDTVYFEHLSYMSVLPLHRLCKNLKMRIVDIEKQDIHGGTLRVCITHESSDHKENGVVGQYIYNEKNDYNSFQAYSEWAKKVNRMIGEFYSQLLDLKQQKKRIAGFAASAKGNTLLNSASITTDIIEYIVDETPEKIGKYSPGTGIPIVNKRELIHNPPDYLIILSWNFKEEIIAKVREFYHGKFIIPIPKFEIID